MIPDAYYKDIFEIDYNKLKKVGIKNIFFDIDNTIIPYKQTKINKKTLDLFKKLRKEFNVFLFSNSPKKRVLKIADKLGVNAYYSSMKPLKKNYKKIINIFKKNECVFVGDQFMTDVFGAKRNNLKVIFVDKLEKYEPITTKFWRFLEKGYLKKYKKKKLFELNKYYDRLRKV
ncbi:MAG: YqeG family HAD IIIA-type phosphatase [Bacilli bacterium]|nr:YqeG family HAD IIIA-type phosphatase [Bacilli bacterium]